MKRLNNVTSRSASLTARISPKLTRDLVSLASLYLPDEWAKPEAVQVGHLVKRVITQETIGQTLSTRSVHLWVDVPIHAEDSQFSMWVGGTEFSALEACAKQAKVFPDRIMCRIAETLLTEYVQVQEQKMAWWLSHSMSGRSTFIRTVSDKHPWLSYRDIQHTPEHTGNIHSLSNRVMASLTRVPGLSLSVLKLLLAAN